MVNNWLISRWVVRASCLRLAFWVGGLRRVVRASGSRSAAQASGLRRAACGGRLAAGGLGRGLTVGDPGQRLAVGGSGQRLAVSGMGERGPALAASLVLQHLERDDAREQPAELRRLQRYPAEGSHRHQVWCYRIGEPIRGMLISIGGAQE